MSNYVLFVPLCVVMCVRLCRHFMRSHGFFPLLPELVCSPAYMTELCIYTPVFSSGIKASESIAWVSHLMPGDWWCKGDLLVMSEEQAAGGKLFCPCLLRAWRLFFILFALFPSALSLALWCCRPAVPSWIWPWSWFVASEATSRIFAQTSTRGSFYRNRLKTAVHAAALSAAFLSLWFFAPCLLLSLNNFPPNQVRWGGSEEGSGRWRERKVTGCQFIPLVSHWQPAEVLRGLVVNWLWEGDGW